MVLPTESLGGQASRFAPALAKPDVLREDRADGSFVLSSATPLLPYERCIPDWLVDWARTDPNRIFLAQRSPGCGEQDWQYLTYAQALSFARSIGQSLLNLKNETSRSVVILSENSINHALLSLGAMMVGRIPTAVSVAYSTSKNMSKVHGILAKLQPCMIFAEDGETYAAALAGAPANCVIVTARNHLQASIPFDQLLTTRPTTSIEQAFSRITGDTVARWLLTSGSTGAPKLVPNTHRMLCANQRMIAQCWKFIDRAQPVIVDWLPWSHTFGANHNFNLILRNGGTLYIDEGRPLPGLIGRTVRNIIDVAPTLYFNVPKGFDMLAPYLDSDPQFAERFFSRLNMLFYAAASLPAPLWEKYQLAACRVRSSPVFFASAWGATETAPVITNVHFTGNTSDNIGVPVPGVQIKFVPNGDKLEMRVRGPSVFAGYKDDDRSTALAFDEEGFYRTGDAGNLAELRNPSAGILFNGRIAEDFKLSTGTWVSVSMVRQRILSALAGYAQDVVVAGHDRSHIGLLIFPSLALRALSDESSVAPSDLWQFHPAVRTAIQDALEVAAVDAGPSQCAICAVLLSKPPSLESGEITDKGYINQRAVLTQRQEEVDRLFSNSKSVFRIGG